VLHVSSVTHGTGLATRLSRLEGKSVMACLKKDDVRYVTGTTQSGTHEMWQCLHDPSGRLAGPRAGVSG
jgi:hypothetical protein